MTTLEGDLPAVPGTKKLKDMTPEERKAVTKAAVDKFREELKTTGPAIAKVLRDFDAQHGEKGGQG